MDLQITNSRPSSQAPITIIHLDGRINMGNSSLLEEEAQKCLDQGTRFLIFDLSKVESMTSSGLRSLLAVAKSFNNSDAEAERGNRKKSLYVKLAQPSQEISRLLHIAGFNIIFDIYPDIQQAISSF